jgi:hypothetical protein
MAEAANQLARDHAHDAQMKAATAAMERRLKAEHEQVD